jgi:hypothetical protein
MSSPTETDDHTRTFNMVRCGVCNGPVYYSPVAPPPDDGTPCVSCMDWAVKAIVTLHKRPAAL